MERGDKRSVLLGNGALVRQALEAKVGGWQRHRALVADFLCDRAVLNATNGRLDGLSVDRTLTHVDDRNE